MGKIVVIEGELSLTSQICGEIDKVMMVDSSKDYYPGPYVVTPLVHNEVVLATRRLAMSDNVTVLKVPYQEAANPSGGNTATIGEN